MQLRSRFLVFYTRLNYVTDIKLFWVHVLWWRDVLVFTCWIAEGRCHKVNAVSPVGCLKFLCSIVLWNVNWKKLETLLFFYCSKKSLKVKHRETVSFTYMYGYHIQCINKTNIHFRPRNTFKYEHCIKPWHITLEDCVTSLVTFFISLKFFVHVTYTCLVRANFGCQNRKNVWYMSSYLPPWSHFWGRCHTNVKFDLSWPFCYYNCVCRYCKNNSQILFMR